MHQINTLLNRDPCRNRLSPSLEKLYGGPLGFPPPTVKRPYTLINFVKTLDGLVSFQLPGQEHAQYISNYSKEDAFVMGLLRALSDAVLEGTTNIVGFPQHTLIPARVDAAHAPLFAALRTQLKKPVHPLHVFLTRNGTVLAKTPLKSVSQIPVVFRSPDIHSIVITTHHGAERVKKSFLGFEQYQPEIFAAGKEINLNRAMHYLRQFHNVKLLVVEGGPRLCGGLVQSSLYDEWFLTTAPQMIGNSIIGGRPTLVQGIELTPKTAHWHRLISLKVSGDIVFERYRRRYT